MLFLLNINKERSIDQENRNRRSIDQENRNRRSIDQEDNSMMIIHKLPPMVDITMDINLIVLEVAAGIADLEEVEVVEVDHINIIEMSLSHRKVLNIELLKSTLMMSNHLRRKVLKRISYSLIIIIIIKRCQALKKNMAIINL
jgi:hypothetical protein